VLELSSFKNFWNQTIGCGDIAYSQVGYFILSHPVEQIEVMELEGYSRPTYRPNKLVHSATTRSTAVDVIHMLTDDELWCWLHKDTDDFSKSKM